MSITIRSADLKTDRDTLVELLARYINPLTDTRRFEWLYQHNPDGPASVWMAEDRAAAQVVGSAAAFPRRMFVDGAETLGCVLADLWIHPEHRSLGPALQLQRACMAAVESGRFALAYDFPQRSMIAVYRRLGITPSDSLLRLAKPLRTERKLAQILGAPRLARWVAAVADVVLRWVDRPSIPKDETAIARHEGPCGAEFSDLARRCRPVHGVCVARSAEYLNWRFQEHFHHRHELLVARRAGTLVGYLVLLQREDDAQILDLFGVEEPAILGGLVVAATDLLRRRGVAAVSAQVLASHPRATLFRQAGFRPRESAPVVFHAPGRLSAGGGHGWFLMYGDEGD
jgi:hypothetical protein